MSTRPSRTGGTGTSGQIIAAGPSTDPLLLPTSTRPSRNGGISPNSIPAVVSAIEDLEDTENPDTTGFLFDDQNIFDTGGLNQSDALFMKRYKAGFPKRKFTPIAYLPVPGMIQNIKGKDWEFLGYVGEDLAIDETEDNSFEAYEKSEFSGLFKNLIGKLKSPSLNQAMGIVSKNSPKKLGLFRRFKNPDHLYQNFDGYEEVEYGISDDPAMSDFFLVKAIKAVGKGIGKAVKAVGKAAKAVGKGVKNAVKATGKGLRNATKWTGKKIEQVSKFALNNIGMGGAAAQAATDESNGVGAYSTPLEWSQQTAAMDMASGGYDINSMYPEYGNSLVEATPQYDAGGKLVYNEPETVSTSSKNKWIIIAAIASVAIIGGIYLYKKKK